MMPVWVRPLFLIAGLYDLGLGVGFAFGFRAIYERAAIALPNHDAYVQLPAALIAIFGLGFLMVARDPVRNRNLIGLGVLLKLAFSGIVFFHRATRGIPDLWVPFAIADVVFLLAFLVALRVMPKRAASD